MINLEFKNAGGGRINIEYDVHPRSQEQDIPVPEGATSVVIWLGVKSGGHVEVVTE